MSDFYLICCDLDRTILPNGAQEESPRARPLLRELAQREDVILAYVSGRGKRLLQDAIGEYGIPVPDYAIGDVGTTLYEVAEGWTESEAWNREIARDWNGRGREELEAWLRGIEGLKLQEPEKQNTHKLSYYVDLSTDRRAAVSEIESRLKERGVRASVIWSVDEANHTGLIDVLPERATKLHAIRFLMDRLNASAERTVFAGDSGNDLPVLTSGLQAVLVKNAMDEVREEAERMVARAAERGIEKTGNPGRLYIAKGGFLGMNGNYSAGVLEGVAHFLPELGEWLAAQSEA